MTTERQQRRHPGSGWHPGFCLGVGVCRNWRGLQETAFGPDTDCLGGHEWPVPGPRSNCSWTRTCSGKDACDSTLASTRQAYHYARSSWQQSKSIWQKEIKLVSYSSFPQKCYCTWGESHSQGDRYCTERTQQRLSFLCSFKACVGCREKMLKIVLFNPIAFLWRQRYLHARLLILSYRLLNMWVETVPGAAL